MKGGRRTLLARWAVPVTSVSAGSYKIDEPYVVEPTNRAEHGRTQRVAKSSTRMRAAWPRGCCLSQNTRTGSSRAFWVLRKSRRTNRPAANSGAARANGKSPAKAGFDDLHGQVEAVTAPMGCTDQRARVGQRQIAAAHQYLAHIEQVLQIVDAPTAQRRMVRGQGGDQRLHRNVLEAAARVDLQSGEGHAQADPAAIEQVQRFFLGSGKQFDVQQGIALAQGGDGAEQSALVDVRHHGDGQAAFQPLGQFQRMGLQQPQLLGDQPRMGLQGTGLRGGTCFAGTPLEQGSPAPPQDCRWPCSPPMGRAAKLGRRPRRSRDRARRETAGCCRWKNS